MMVSIMKKAQTRSPLPFISPTGLAENGFNRAINDVTVDRVLSPVNLYTRNPRRKALNP